MSEIQIGTDHFASEKAALVYYEKQGYGLLDVAAKINEGLIHIGAPPPREGCTIHLVDGIRYAYVEKHEPARKLPKSLHTVSVLCNLTRHFMDVDGQIVEDGLERAVNCLKLDELDDAYGLIDAAKKQLEK